MLGGPATTNHVMFHVFPASSSVDLELSSNVTGTEVAAITPDTANTPVILDMSVGTYTLTYNADSLRSTHFPTRLLLLSSEPLVVSDSSV